MYLVYYVNSKNHHIGSYSDLKSAQESIKLAPKNEQKNYVIIEGERPKYEE